MPLMDFNYIPEEPIPEAGVEIPGWSTASVLSEVKDAALSGLHGAGWALDVGGRPLRSFLMGKGLTEAASSIWTGEAPSAEDVRKSYFGSFEGEARPGWNKGKILGLGADVLTGAFSDPLFYATLGATTVGKQALQQGGKLTKALAASADPAMQRAAREAFLAATKKAAPKVIPAQWKGLEPTLMGRLAKGETGISTQIPFLTNPTPLPIVQPLVSGAAKALQPITSTLGAAAEWIPGRKWAGRYAESLVSFVTNPTGRRALEGIEASAESAADEAVRKIIESRIISGIHKPLTEAGIPETEHWALRNLFEALDPSARVITKDGRGVPLFRTEAPGTEVLKQNYDEAIPIWMSWTPEQRAKATVAMQSMQEVKREAKELLGSYGVATPELGGKILERRTNITEKMAQFDKEIPEAEAAAKKFFTANEVTGGKRDLKKYNDMIAKIDEMKAAREQLGAELPHVQRLVNSIPNYFPHKVLEEVELAGKVGFKAPGTGKAGALTHARLTRPDEQYAQFLKDNKLSQSPLGIPLTAKETEDMILSGGSGTRATGFVNPEDTVHIMNVVRPWFSGKQSWSKAVAAEKAAAATRVGFFSEHPVDAYYRYLKQDVRNSIRTKQAEDMISNTWGMPIQSWKNATDAVAAGKPMSEIKAAFQKETGKDIVELLSPQVQAAVKTHGDSALAAALKGSSGPYQTVPFKDWFLPTDVARQYDRYLQRSTVGLADTFKDIIGPYATYLRYWKPAQVLWPVTQLRNQVGDFFRMAQWKAVDGQTANDIAAFAKGALKAGNKGYGDFSVWADQMVMVGGKQVPLSEMLQQMAPKGIIGTGRTSEEFGKAAEKLSTTNIPAALQKIGSIKEGFKQMMFYREDANRVAAVLARMRRGDSLEEAVQIAEEALYNQFRISPAANWLRRTGVAPFISWQARNIPAQLDWALSNPGQFGAALRLMDELPNMPEAMVPKYARDKYNIVMQQTKDEKGNTVWSYVTNSGVIPITDLDEMRKAPGNYMFSQLGPLFKFGLEVGAKALGFSTEEDETIINNALKSAGRPYQMYENIIGKPGTVDPKTGQVVKRDSLLTLLSPYTIKALKPLDAAEQAVKSSKYELNKVQGALKRAQHKIEEAKILLPDTPDNAKAFAYLWDNFRNAQNAYQRKFEDYKLAVIDQRKTKTMVETMGRAP